MSQAGAIAAVLRASRNVLLLNHVSPDGDTLGCTLALARALDRLGVRATVGSHDGVPRLYAFLPGAARVVAAAPPEAFDASVFMECSDPARAGSLADAGLACPVVVNIDHHLSSTGYGTHVWWDTAAAAVGEMVYDLIGALGVPVDAAMATCLYTAVMTDTGSFRFSNTTARSLEVAAALVAAGADPFAIAQAVYERRSLGAVRLQAAALAELRVEGAIAWTMVTRGMLRDAGATIEDAAGLAGMLRTIDGVRVGLVFEEWPDAVKVSLRSRDGVASNRIAEAFGGGGHLAAAGFSAPGPLDRVIESTLAEVRREVRDSAPLSWTAS